MGFVFFLAAENFEHLIQRSRLLTLNSRKKLQRKTSEIHLKKKQQHKTHSRCRCSESDFFSPRPLRRKQIKVFSLAVALVGEATDLGDESTAAKNDAGREKKKKKVRMTRGDVL